MSITLTTDQAINAWYESQSEATLRDLQDRFDAQTPRQAWEAFFNDCPPPAPQSPGESLAVPASAVQEVCSFRAPVMSRAPTTVDAFDGYVGALRRLDVSVSFQSPAVAVVSGACS